jgi:hypothetical protein
MVTVKRSRELEEFAREGRRRFEAGDEAWFGETTHTARSARSARRRTSSRAGEMRCSR